jgi:hypothetical protein
MFVDSVTIIFISIQDNFNKEIIEHRLKYFNDDLNKNIEETTPLIIKIKH